MLQDDIIYISGLLACIALGPYYRKIDDVKTKQWIGTAIGFTLAILVSGYHILHPIICTIVNAIIITQLSWKKSHTVSLIFSSFYLFVIFRLSDWFGLAVSSGHTNLIMMILTLKMPGLAFELNSAATADADNSTGLKSDALKNVNFMDVIHYAFSYIGILAGPYYRYQTYWDSLHRPFSKYINPWPETFSKLVQIIGFAIVFMITSNVYPMEYSMEDEFAERSFWYRAFYIYPTFITFRMRMYIGMGLAECVCQMSGLGAYPVSCQSVPGHGPKKYNEVENVSEKIEKLKNTEYDFETVQNMKPWEVEKCYSVRTAMKMWNCCTQYWIATCIYKRFPIRALRTSLCLLYSATWHGYASGYYLCIVSVAFYLPIEDIYMKFLNKTKEGSIARNGMIAFLWYMRYSCMSYLGAPFQLLDFYKSWYFYRNIYFYGHVLAITVFIVGKIAILYLLPKTKKVEDKKM